MHFCYLNLIMKKYAEIENQMSKDEWQLGQMVGVLP